ncbi:MAG: Gfo/Idh/MocA family oxidoreductase [Cyanobacteria bacterium J06614_10]
MVIRVGLVGTGYAARVRAEALVADERSQLVCVAGRTPERSDAFAARYGISAVQRWQQLVTDDGIDVVVVCTVSSLHGAVVEAALGAGKHVVVEYPLSLELAQAYRLVARAASQGLLLHVEHIELLGGLHLAMQAYLPRIGTPTYVSYRTINPQHPAPRKWTYHSELFGFPFCGALSRVHRMTQLFGRVRRVTCCTRRVPSDDDADYLKSILSSGRLQFESGVVAELTYGKGEGWWVKRRDVEVQGSMGAIAFVGNAGTLTTAQGTEPIAIAPRKGLFLKDTQAVLDYLTAGTPLYVSPHESVYALAVGDALRRASVSGKTVCLDDFHDEVC